MKKLKLKPWVKKTLTVLLTTTIVLVLGLIVKSEVGDFKELASQCDQDHGYTCSYYDIRQYSLNR